MGKTRIRNELEDVVMELLKENYGDWRYESRLAWSKPMGKNLVYRIIVDDLFDRCRYKIDIIFNLQKWYGLKENDNYNECMWSHIVDVQKY